MKTMRANQNGFAMPFMFIAVAITFIGSLNLKSEDGTAVAEVMGLGVGEESEFAAMEQRGKANSVLFDK